MRLSSLALALGASLACVALAAASLPLAPALAYDPWAWLVWGRELAGGELRTVLGPSWKPLPVLVTAPAAALLGDAAPAAWLLVARAGALGALVVAFRLGARLGGVAAGVAAALLLGVAPWLWSEAALGNSEPLLLLALLGALDRWWAGRRGPEFALLVVAALLRPEAWPLLGAAALALVRERPSRWRAVLPALALVPALWLLPEALASGNALRAADVAQAVTEDAPGAADRPALAVLAEAARGLPAGAVAGLALAALVAALGRAPGRAGGGSSPARLAEGSAPAAGGGSSPARLAEGSAPAAGGGSSPARLAAVLAGLALGWLALVAVMAEAGFSGRLRYSAPALAAACVLAGAGLAWAAAAVRDGALRSARRGRALAAGAVVVVALAGAAAELASRAPEQVRELRHRAALRDELGALVARGGGARRLVRCGPAATHGATATLVAWTLGVPIAEVGTAPRAPGVALRARAQRDRPAAPPAGLLAARPTASTPRWALELACR